MNNEVLIEKIFLPVSEINKKLLSNFDVHKKDDSYLLELDIPCINLKELVYDMDSELNSIDYHVEILKNSNLEKNIYFLAGHSGSSDVSFFNNLVSLKKGDIIFIRTKNFELCYIVENLYLIEKNGYLEIENLKF